MNNLHGIDLEDIHQHLVDPALKNYYNDFQNKVGQYWVVFDEEPQDLKEGYLINYFEQRNQFGLAVRQVIQSQTWGLL